VTAVPRSSTDAPLVVVTCRDGDLGLARQLAKQLELPFLPDAPSQHALAGLELVLGPERLELRDAGRRIGPISADFLLADFARRRRLAGRRSEPLARAVGLGKGELPQVLDATAGLGRDSVLLAWLGCEVTAVERHPVVAALLQDGLRRAAAAPLPMPMVAARVHLVVGDARLVLAAGVEPRPDVVLLDPMFPRERRTALARRELQLLRRLVGDDEDAHELLARALQVARRRVVVKRHAQAPPLAGRRPDLRLAGASTRFDVYLRAPG